MLKAVKKLSTIRKKHCNSSCLTLRSVSDKRIENKTHFTLSNSPPPESRAVYEIMLKNIVQPGRPQMTIWCMRSACWVTKATKTHSDYVVIMNFPLQRWLRERASMSRCTYAACLDIFKLLLRDAWMQSAVLFLVFVWFILMWRHLNKLNTLHRL
jgi:hypothetical protein